MDEIKELMQHLTGHLHAHKLETIALRQLIQNVSTREPQYDEIPIQLDTGNQKATQKVRPNFDARYVTVFNPTSVPFYLAEGEPATQPATAKYIPATGSITLMVQKSNVFTIFQNGTPAAGADGVLLQFSDHLMPLGGVTL